MSRIKQITVILVSFLFVRLFCFIVILLYYGKIKMMNSSSNSSILVQGAAKNNQHLKCDFSAIYFMQAFYLVLYS